jgi:hypothetical protein
VEDRQAVEPLAVRGVQLEQQCWMVPWAVARVRVVLLHLGPVQLVCQAQLERLRLRVVQQLLAAGAR